jgi:O-antigen/teichoic acid export membrane protein
MTISIVNRASFAGIVILVVVFHGDLSAMGVAAAFVNVVTGLLQVVIWRRVASHIHVSVRAIDFRILRAMARYCSSVSIWIVGMLCVTGLDVTIVGHYDYLQTAYYSIATLPTSFMLLIISSMVNPLMPASSAISTQRSNLEMGDFLAKITRYSTSVLFLTGLPLIVCSFLILRLWVGPQYAFHTVTYLRILVFANIIRNLCAPYATMICATGRQGSATASVISEAIVNLGSSVYLASRFGAIGVALGTALGSFVSVALHFALTMHFTHEALSISRARLLFQGLLRPAMIGIPSLILLPFWWSPSRLNLGPPFLTIWGISTLLFAWFSGLNNEERQGLLCTLRCRIMSRSGFGKM